MRINERTAYSLAVSCLVALAVLAMFVHKHPQPKPRPRMDAPRTISLPTVRESRPRVRPAVPAWHPPHIVKTWTAVYRRRTFAVTQLPNCEHMEAVISYNRSGETLKQSRIRLSGVAACSGSFHNPKTMALADFLQQNGSVLSAPKTSRWYLAIHEDGKLDILKDYSLIKGRSGASGVALGQRLVPLQYDGFTVAFMNRVTDRMAIGLNSNFVFIVRGKSDIWRLAEFMKHTLPCKIAVNSDGGHVVRGKAPVHIVFRWKAKPTVTRSHSSSPHYSSHVQEANRLSF